MADISIVFSHNIVVCIFRAMIKITNFVSEKIRSYDPSPIVRPRYVFFHDDIVWYSTACFYTQIMDNCTENRRMYSTSRVIRTNLQLSMRCPGGIHFPKKKRFVLKSKQKCVNCYFTSRHE